MKRVLVLLFFLLPFAAQAQQESKHSFGILAGAGKAQVLQTSLEGSPSLALDMGGELGLSYLRQLRGGLAFESGLFYHHNRLIQRSAPRPDVPQTTTEYRVHLLYVPLFMRLNLSKNFFVNGGALADIDLSNPLDISSSRVLSKQSGLGFGLGLGGELALSNNFMLQLNPYLNLHGALLLEAEQNPGRILDAGIRLGIRSR